MSQTRFVMPPQNNSFYKLFLTVWTWELIYTYIQLVLDKSRRVLFPPSSWPFAFSPSHRLLSLLSFPSHPSANRHQSSFFLEGGWAWQGCGLFLPRQWKLDIVMVLLISREKMSFLLLFCRGATRTTYSNILARRQSSFKLIFIVRSRFHCTNVGLRRKCK